MNTPIKTQVIFNRRLEIPSPEEGRKQLRKWWVKSQQPHSGRAKYSAVNEIPICEDISAFHYETTDVFSAAALVTGTLAVGGHLILTRRATQEGSPLYIVVIACATSIIYS